MAINVRFAFQHLDHYKLHTLYCRPRLIFQVRASEELVWRLTRKGVVRGAASGRDNEAFSMPAGEGSETDRSEGRSKRQKEKERGGEGAGCRIRQ
jgi:hypothetical protein